MQPGQQAYQRYRYAEPAGRLYVRATGSRLLCRDGTRGGYWALYAASDEQYYYYYYYYYYYEDHYYY